MQKGNKAAVVARYVVCYGLAAVLLGYYLVILYLGVHPQVPARYRAFYLDHVLTYYPKPERSDIVPGQAVDLDKAWLNNWEWLESTGWCITNQNSQMVFCGEPGRAYHVTATFEAPNMNMDITVRANGEQVVYRQFTAAEQSVEFDTPSLPEDGYLILDMTLGGEFDFPVLVKEMILS